MLPRKQRHTAKRAHDRLRAETDYDGVEVREALARDEPERFRHGKLVRAPRVAQIDFGCLCSIRN